MFTGIVESVSKVTAINRTDQGMEVKVGFPGSAGTIKAGDSVAVNGVCLTATLIEGEVLTFDVMNESLSHTNLTKLTNQSYLNLERAMAVNSRFGGHYVSGHVDFSTTIKRIVNDGFAKRITLSLPNNYRRYCVHKGSICIDGISLTIASVNSNTFEVSIIPHTLGNTNLGQWKAGDVVNIEVDVIGKYVEQMLGHLESDSTTKITNSFLSENGFN